MIAANLLVSKDPCNKLLKALNTFGQKNTLLKLELIRWWESLASHPSLDILIFTLGRNEPGQKKLFFRRPRRRQTKIRLLHFGILRQRAVDPGQRKPGRQPQARPAWKGCVSTHTFFILCLNHPGFFMLKGLLFIKNCWQR